MARTKKVTPKSSVSVLTNIAAKRPRPPDDSDESDSEWDEPVLLFDTEGGPAVYVSYARLPEPLNACKLSSSSPLVFTMSQGQVHGIPVDYDVNECDKSSLYEKMLKWALNVKDNSKENDFAVAAGDPVRVCVIVKDPLSLMHSDN